MKKKAEDVAEIMGGKFQDYINVILNMPCKSTVQEIIESLIAEGENKKENVCRERKAEKEGEVKGVPMEKLFEVEEKQKKILKKRFSDSIKKKAAKVAEILGETAELYYGICDAWCLSDPNEIIEIILNDPEMLSKHTSYKN